MNRYTRSAFSLVELLVVMSIILLLSAMAAPAVQQVPGAALAARCKYNLQQLGSAVHLYHADHSMVPMWITSHDPHYAGPMPMPAHLDQNSYVSVHVRILPYLDQNTIYDAINWDGPRVTTLRYHFQQYW